MRIHRALALLAIVLAAGMAMADSGVAAAAGAPKSVSEVVDHFMIREAETIKAVSQHHPLVETYTQTFRSDSELGSVPTTDRYFIGRLDVSSSIQERFYGETTKVGLRSAMLQSLDPTRLPRKMSKTVYSAIGFAAMIFPDMRGLNRDHYYFQFVRREFLGDVRCMMFQVVPKDQNDHGRFLGRIWVEDQDYNIVRFNGTYTHPAKGDVYFHMDSWRSNVQAGVWLPSEVYSEESDPKTEAKHQVSQFRAQIRLWGYDLKPIGRQEEFTQMVVDSNTVKDEDTARDMLPVSSLREWQHDAEQNVLDRLEQAGLLAPPSPLDNVLLTVVNNLVITNNLDNLPEIHCRVLLTTPMESFTVGHTIVVSRGLLDVLPDEGSLAMVLSHELAHIVKGDKFDTKYAFGDRMWTADESIFSDFHFRHSPEVEQEADKIALDMLQKSPYKEKLNVAGLFLRQLAARADNLPNLTRARLGDGLVKGGTVVRMPSLMNSAPTLEMRKLDQIAALPLGGRVKLDPWSRSVDLLKANPVRIQSAHEKMPFELAPVLPHLTRLSVGSVVAASPAATPAADTVAANPAAATVTASPAAATVTK